MSAVDTSLASPDARDYAVRDQLTGRLFDSFLALHRWRARHGVVEASCHVVEAPGGERVFTQRAGPPREDELV